MLRGFNAGHRESLSRLALASMWRQSQLREIAPYDDVKELIATLSADLLKILEGPTARAALSRTRPDEDTLPVPDLEMSGP